MVSVVFCVVVKVLLWCLKCFQCIAMQLLECSRLLPGQSKAVTRVFIGGFWGILHGCQGVAIVFEMFLVYFHAHILCVVAWAILGDC